MSLATDSSFTTTVSRMVLETETNDGRFESFCRDTVAGLEGGATILSTSLSWDLGRDGVGAGRADGLYVCCSLRDDVDAKALSDIQRLSKTTRGVKRVYFCSNHGLSEHRRDSIVRTLMAEVEDSFEVVCFGGAQLLDSARGREPNVLERHYGVEISNTLRAIQPDLGDETEIKGLRLALITSAADNSAAIRNEVYAAGLLDTLRDGVPRTIARCAKDLSESLKLQRNIADGAIRPHLNHLIDDGSVSFHESLYAITAVGEERVIQRERAAASRLLSGRQAIRDSLEQAIGSRLIDDQFNRMWAVFEERMAQYFLSRGEAMVSEISELLASDQASASSPTHVNNSPLSFLDELAQAVANTSSHAQQREELRLGVRDLFTDRTSVATEWLVKLSASFVAACALGLEHSTGLALSKLLGRTTLVLDTDVILSLVGEGEPEHEGVQTLVTRWPQMGGKVLVSEPVLEEVAYHAAIAQSDFDGVLHRLPGTADERLHLIGNAFVRSFAELLSQQKIRPNQWRKFIDQYRGADRRDWSVFYATVSTDNSIGKLPPRSTSEVEIESKVRAFLSVGADGLTGDALRNAKDKARRDAELYSALVHHVRVLKATDPGATCLLVSSSRRLSKAEAQFHESGEPQLIVSISTILYLLAMLPGVSLGLTAMKAFLFDERRRSFSSELERTLIRVVRSSQEVSMPWAKRGALMRSVREGMIAEAHAQGISVVSPSHIAAMEREALTPQREGRTLELLRDALDAIAVDTRTARENVDLRAKIKDLESRLAKTNLPPKTAATKDKRTDA